MNTNICKCSLGKQNTQGNSCPDLMQIAKRLIIVPKFKADGTVNEFANIAAVTKTALQAKFDAAEIDDRWFPLSELKNVEDLRGDTVFEEFTDRSKVKVDENKRNFVGHIINQGSILFDKIKAWGCQEFGVYIIDKNSNFVYNTDSTLIKVQPIAVDANSWDIKLVKATDTEVEKIMISFDFAQNMRDENLRYLAAEDLDFDGLDTGDVYALYDVNGVVSAISTTGFTMTLTTDYGLPVKNLLITDFAVYNTTTAAAVTIVTMTETADGVYAFTFTAQTQSDVLQLTPTKSRYDFADVVSIAITIP